MLRWNALRRRGWAPVGSSAGRPKALGGVAPDAEARPAGGGIWTGEAPQEESQPFGAAAPASDIAEQDRHSEGDAAPKRRRLSDSVKAMAMAACFHK